MDFYSFFLIIFTIITIVAAGLTLGAFTFGLSMFFGAPFVPTHPEVLKRMIKLANPQPGELIYDLGSGDGRIIIEAVKNYNVRAIGIEIHPLLVYSSRRKIQKLGLQEKAKVWWGNFFMKDISDADIILMYLLQPTNRFLENKFLSKLKPGTKIVSLSFTFSKIPFVKSDLKYKHIRLYQIPSQK